MSTYHNYNYQNFWHHVSFPENQKAMINYFNQFIVSSFDANVQVHLLTEFIPRKEINHYLIDVPLICINDDKYIETQGSNKPYKNPQKFYSYRDLIKRHPNMLSYEERIRARRKIIISNNLIFARGGYHTSFKIYKQPISCVIVTYAAPQLENRFLEYSLYIKPITRYSKGIQISKVLYFDNHSYYDDIKKDILLILSTINLYCENKKKAYVHIVAAGTGFFSVVPEVGNINVHIYPLILQVYAEILGDKYHFKNIDTLCLLDFDGKFQMRKTFDNIKVTYERNRDVLDFTYLNINDYTLCLINPGDAFSAIGNELGYESVEAEIGNNTTLRITQNYFYNSEVLKNIVAR